MAAEARKTGDQSLPKRIGRYEAFLQIGAGGMARVYLAVLRGLPGQKAELVVVKILRPEVVEDEHVLALFTDEARIAMRLQHPNVIRTREVIAGPPDYVLAMDFHNGRSLLDVVTRLGREAIPLDEHIFILTKVLAGLSYAHELKDEKGQPFGIVHRDVSPANVLVSYGGEVKLLDFGIAKATGALAATRDGVVRGKLGYAAPEQALGRPADPRSDVYAVGIMLWEAIAGRRRVSGETWQSVLQARLDDTEASLEEVRPDAPPALAAIVKKALARDPNDRYPTARDFQAELEGYLREKRAVIGPSRIAAMLKPHFDQDRADLQKAVEAFLLSLKSGKTGQVSRIPLPGGRAAAAAKDAAEPTAPVEETTAPIPVDSALLMLTRTETDPPPPESSTPTAPPPPDSLSATAPPPPPDSLSVTAPPPPNPLTTTAPPPPESSTPTAPPPSEVAVPSPIVGMARGEIEKPEDVITDDALSADPPPAPVLSTPAAFPKPPVAIDAFGLVPSAVPVQPYSPSAIDVAPTKKKGSALPFVLLALGAVALGAVVVVPRLTASKTPAVATPAQVTEPTPATTTSSPSKVDMVKVRISVDPADAIVTLDGQKLEGNPYVATLPRDNAAHQLTAVAEGCEDRQQAVHLNSDLALLVAMKCQRQGLRLAGHPVPRKPGSTTAAAAPPPKPAPQAATPSPAAPPAPPAAAPAPAPAPAPVSDENPYK